MRYHFFQKISWENFPCQMTTKDIPEISFWELSMGYRWDSPCLLEISIIYPFHTRGTYCLSMICPTYILSCCEDISCLSMTKPRDISCCFRNRLSGMQPAIESSNQISAQCSRRFIKHNPIYYFFFLPWARAGARVRARRRTWRRDLAGRYRDGGILEGWIHRGRCFIGYDGCRRVQVATRKLKPPRLSLTTRSVDVPGVLEVVRQHRLQLLKETSMVFWL